MKRHTSLRGLRTFCEAAKHQSFRNAADRMYVTASAVSHQIKNLEDELGQQLFERRARDIRLTDAGRSLFDDVHPLIEQLDDAVATYRRNQARQSLNISVQPFFASELFVPRLPEFTNAHPEFDIRIDTSDESNEKVAGSADVSIRIFRSPPKGLYSHRLFPLRLIPVGSPEFKRSLRVTKRQVKSRFPLIVHEGRPKAWKDWERISGIRLPEDSSQLRLASMIAVARAAERGLGAALVPVALSQSWLTSGSLVPLFDDALETRDAYYFACSLDNADKDSVNQLKQWVLHNFADAT
ncbi:MAG: LysR family transcriptional regulator [Pseudomonadota bacterium]